MASHAVVLGTKLCVCHLFNLYLLNVLRCSPEIEGPVTWCVEYHLPNALFVKYFGAGAALGARLLMPSRPPALISLVSFSYTTQHHCCTCHGCAGGAGYRANFYKVRIHARPRPALLSVRAPYRASGLTVSRGALSVCRPHQPPSLVSAPPSLSSQPANHA